MTEITAKTLSTLDSLADSPSLSLDLDGLLYPLPVVAEGQRLEGPWQLSCSSQGSGHQLQATSPSATGDERRTAFGTLLDHLLALMLTHHINGGSR